MRARHGSPEQILVLSGTGSKRAPIGGNDVGRDQIVAGEASFAADRGGVSGLVLTVGLYPNTLLLVRRGRLPALANPVGLHSAIAFEYRAFMHDQSGCG